MRAAANLLQRAASLLPLGDRERPRLFLSAAEATIESGSFSAAETLATLGIEEAKQLGDRGLEVTGQLVLLDMRLATDPSGEGEAVGTEAAEAIPLLESLEDHEGLARAWRLLTLVNWEACRWRASETAATRMIDQARLAGNRLFEARNLPALATCALYGTTPVPDAILICQDILERTRSDRKATAVTTRTLAHLEAMRGRFKLARDLYRESRAALDELGWHFHAALTSQSSGLIEMLAGDP